jgi:hypothetical protein
LVRGGFIFHSGKLHDYIDWFVTNMSLNGPNRDILDDEKETVPDQEAKRRLFENNELTGRFGVCAGSSIK